MSQSLMSFVSQEKARLILRDLGKATKRGVRKCPKCGTINGTRGHQCKNKDCDHVFRESAARKKTALTLDAGRLITGTAAQIYSVRLREKPPESRGLVQLPVVQNADGEPAQFSDPAMLLPILAAHGRCYIEHCQGPQEEGAEGCVHIHTAATQCIGNAEELPFDEDVLSNMNLTADIKKSLWSLASDTPGPMVQLINTEALVVKCTATPRHPLGFVHVYFPKVTRLNAIDNVRGHCTCKTELKNVPAGRKICLHFCACICAILSDTMERRAMYTPYVNLITNATAASMSNMMNQDAEEHEVLVSADQLHEMLTSSSQVSDVELAGEDYTMEEVLGDDASENTEQKKVPSQRPVSQRVFDEDSTQFTFTQWLSSVTERINQTMHFQFNGHPDPLVFHAPQTFFDCLQTRISAGSKRRRMPNGMTTFFRKDALPLGTFTKYTWQLTHLMHVKQVFDTDVKQLELTRSFVQNKDGTYDAYDASRRLQDPFSNDGKNLPIRPFELKTYLKVGSQHDDLDVTPFIIEWIPDILPDTRIGELRIKFEYGHQRNGRVEMRSPLSD